MSALRRLVPATGTESDNPRSMIRLWFLIASLAACQQQDSVEARNVVSVSSPALARSIASDPVLRAADSVVKGGHPWRATVMLAPLLRDPQRRTPATVLLAARAAAGWNGWSEVDRLLSTETWLDDFGGDGHELLARSALERSADSAALAHAEAALKIADDDRSRAVRQVILARALDRLNDRDRSREAYERGAASLGAVRDWLLLRAAGVTADAGDRARMYARLTIPKARERIGWTEAQALERFGDVERAAAKYASLGANVTAIRLRLSQPTDSAARSRLKHELIDFVRARAGTGDARQAVELLDRYFATPAMALTPAEELVVGRSAAASGPAARAVQAFARADSALTLSDADEMRYADALADVGRTRDAMAMYRKVGGSLAATTAYRRARLMLNTGNGAGARETLREIIARYPGDAAATPTAMYLLADLMTDDGRDTDARALFRRVYTRFPRSSRADEARFRAAMVTYIQGPKRTAALEFDSLVSRMPNAAEANAARYWAGRAWSAVGNTARAKARWRAVIDDDPRSYYALVSARRLGEKPWAPPGSAVDTFPRVAAVDSAVDRIRTLETLGMDVEARFEYDALEESAASSSARLLASAVALRDLGQTPRSVRLGLRALRDGQRDARVFRLIYPLVDREQLVAQARARNLDPALVAGLIRQESSFYPRAVSGAGARGLMQVMPAVGQGIARQLGFPVWDSALLFDPDANLQLGTAHLAQSLRDYDALVRALAAYNAGGSRVQRWSTKAGTNDPEIFAERIPFVETRDYVRIVQRNVELYRALYGL